MLLAIASIAGLVVGAIAFEQRYADDTGTRSRARSGAEAPGPEAPSDDKRVAAIRGFCADPRALTEPGSIASFTPGQGTVALVQVPQASSSTLPAEDLVVQVSPVVGSPGLELEASVDLVSLAVCVERAGSTAGKGTCDYRLTNPDAYGDKASVRLRETTYDISLRELQTGKVLVTGTLRTPVGRCPDIAYLDQGEGVSNSLTDEQVLAWVGENLVNGQPG